MKWKDDMMRKWQDNRMARWHDNVMTLWQDDRMTIEPCFLSPKFPPLYFYFFFFFLSPTFSLLPGEAGSACARWLAITFNRLACQDLPRRQICFFENYSSIISKPDEIILEKEIFFPVVWIIMNLNSICVLNAKYIMW